MKENDLSILNFRAGKREDGQYCGQICYAAFKAIADQHHFPSEFPELMQTIDILTSMLSNSGFYSIIAEKEGKIMGSNFLDERDSIVGIGPISVASDEQNTGLGKQLMKNVIARGLSQKRPGIRLSTAAHHGRSLSLYSKLGFKVQVPLVILQGQCVKKIMPHILVRRAEQADLNATTLLCEKIHGHHRQQEVKDAIIAGTAKIVEREGKITGYTSGISFFGHAVGETNDDIMALIIDTNEYEGAGFLLPTTNHDLFIRCLNHGLKVVMSMVHMTMGLYNQPQGAYLPSILY